MKKLNKPISVLILLILLFNLFSCEEYIDATGGGGIFGDGDGGEEDGGDGGTKQPELNDDPTDDFTVTVKINGQNYVPRMDIDVYWRDDSSVHVAPLNEQGVARIDGLDGDYRVTLSAVPNEYTYDPNAHIATNDDRNIELNLYPLNVLVGGGTGPYDCYKFSATGVYTAKIEKPGDAIFFEYAPSSEGVYTIESWIDTTEDSVNPYIEIWSGTSVGLKWQDGMIEDGGPVGSYTTNFFYQVQIVKEQISSGGQAVYSFAVKAESKFNLYPITVTFAVKRNNEIEPTPILPSANYGLAISEFDFSDFDVSDHEYGSEYTIKYPEYQYTGQAYTYVFDQKRVKLYEKKDGGDGFYHMYDEEKYAESGGYGPILYANVTSACRFIDTSFYNIEYRDGDVINNALSVGGYNYKHFIEGYTRLSTFGNINGGSYYCVEACRCHDADVETKDWACTKECTSCLTDCRRIPEELVGFEGYASYANSDGVVPVTEELKEFLYHYANSPRAQLFRDGAGYVDGKDWDGIMYQAPTGSEWLFACLYYELAE